MDLTRDSVPFSPSGLNQADKNDKIDNVPYQYNPSPAEEKLIKQLTRRFDKAKRYREKYDCKWADYYKMFRGKQWLDGKRPSYLHSEVINLVFQTIQSQVPIMTDTKPRFEYLPQDPTDFELTEILNQITDWDWSRNNWLMVLTEVIFDGHIFGTGNSSLDYDENADNGFGRIKYESEDIFYIFPDPEARDTNKNCREFFKVKPMAIEEIRRKYPEKGKYVKPDAVAFNSMDRSNLVDLKVTSPQSRNVFYEYDSYNNQSASDHAVVYECIYYDETMEDSQEAQTDEQGNQLGLEIVKKKKYPNGRVVAWSGNVVLEDRPNKIEEGFIPYQRFVNYIDPRNFWGISEVEQIEGPQKLFNKLVSFALDILVLTGNPIWIVDTSADIDTDHLTNRPGLIVEKTPGSEVRREPGVQLQSSVLVMIDKLKEYVDQLAGAQDITRGVRPEGVSAAAAISSLQNAAQTRIRLKSRNLDDYLQTLGQQYLALVFQYYTIPQIVRVTNKDNPKLSDYFKFHVEANDLGQRFARIRGYKYNDTEKKYYEENERLIAINKKFDVQVSTGSSMPFSKVEREQRVLSLFDRGIIDAEEVLKALDYPNYQAILSRAQQAAQMQANSGQLQATNM